MNDIRKLEETAAAELNSAQTTETLEAFRIRYFSKKGILTEWMAKIPSLAPDERREFGAAINRCKKNLEQLFEEQKAKLAEKPAAPKFFDETLPCPRPIQGHLHPIRETIFEITSIFSRLGFSVVDGPEIETEFYNFTALNIPLDHASRDTVDTFYTAQGQLLRTQTSTVQVRIMQKQKPPLRIIAPGRVYRPDTVDASHSFMFHQIEGLMVDDRTSFSDLKGVLHLVLRELFGSDIKIRFRPHFFPFTEPSVEVDLRWGNRGWLEILGAGMVNPKVFEAAGYDPSVCQGFAFGMGVERIAMLRHGIQDIRFFYDNDLRFLKQF